jgi:hypothetical protein
MTTLVLIAIGLLVCLFSAGLIAEALPIAPKPPERLFWGEDIPIAYVEVEGDRLRCGQCSQRVLGHSSRRTFLTRPKA